MPLGLFTTKLQPKTRHPNPLKNPPTDCKEEDIDCHFPDLADKHPDCAVISDQDLLSLTENKWESTTIPYSLSAQEPNWVGFVNTLAGFKDLHAQPIAADVRDAMEQSIKHAFDKFTAITNGKLKFEKKSTFHNRTPFFADVFSRGITFMFPGTEREIADATQAGGFTIWRLNNNGYLRDTAIYLPNDPHYWHFNPKHYLHYTWLHQAIAHEIQHALGILDWTDKQYLLDRLKNVREGAYCSIMPYPHLIASETSQCDASSLSCNPPYAVFPAQLDQRWLQQVYEQQAWEAPDYNSRMTTEKTINFNHNSHELVMFAFFFTLWHQLLLGLTTGYANKSRHPERNHKLANAIADGAMILTMLLLEMPWEMELIFGLTSLNKYVPDSLLNRLAPPLRNVASASYNDLAGIMYAIAANGSKYIGFGTYFFSMMAMGVAFLPKVVAYISGMWIGEYFNPVNAQANAAEPAAEGDHYRRLEEGNIPERAPTPLPERSSPRLLQWMATSPRQGDQAAVENERSVSPVLRCQ
jgi:hypothetical protein